MLCRSFSRVFPMARSFSAPSRVFAEFTLFKNTGCLGVSPVAPVFAPVQGGMGDAQKVERQGVMMLKFVPPVGGGELGYLWAEKQHFALSAVECGELLTITPGTKKELTFIHDPNLREPESNGEMAKKLRIAPMQHSQGDMGFIYAAPGFELMVPVSSAEFRVMQSLINFSLPKLLGFDAVFEPGLAGSGEAAAPRYQPPPYGAQGVGNVTPLKQGGNVEGDWPF
jgi:hypothetical protein